MRKIWKQSLAFLCVVAFLVSLMPSVLAYGNSSSWAKYDLDKIEALGLIPQELQEKADLRDDITRLEMCSAAVLTYETLMGQTITVTNSKPFTDTDSTIAAKAHAVGLIKGYGDGTFRPQQMLTREEFFCFIYQFLQSSGWNDQERFYADLSRFDDHASVASWALKAAQAAVGTGIVQGTGTSLEPKSLTSCEEALIMFYRAYMIMDAQGEPTPRPPFCPEEPTEPEPTVPEPTEPEPTEPEPTEPAPVEKTFEEKYPGMAKWAIEELKPMDESCLIPSVLEGRDMASNITRKEACYIATTAFFAIYPDYVPEKMDSPFTDVDDTIITTAYYLGIINGYPGGIFKPDDPITREQFFSIIGNFLMVVEFNRIDDETVDLSIFTDGHLVQDYAKPATRLLYSMGIVKGSDNKLEPRAHTQCQQALALFYRTYLYYQNWIESSMNEDEKADGREEADALVEFALQFVGYDYVWGAEHPDDGFDCSGLVYYVYRHFGYMVGRTATNQWYYEDSWEVSRDELLPGDLMFFHDGNPYEISHIGIYIGDGLFVHAANSNRGVVVDSIDNDYYVRHYFGARRIIP